MTRRQLLDLGLKAYGIYQLIRFIREVPSLYFLLRHDFSEFFSAQQTLQALSIFNAALALFLAITFIFFSGRIAAWFFPKDKPVSSPPAQLPPVHRSLSLWIVVLGLYFFVTSLGDLINHLVGMFTAADAGPFENRVMRMYITRRDLIPSIVVFFLSMLLVFRSRAVERFIGGHGKNVRPPGAKNTSVDDPMAGSSKGAVIDPPRIV